MVDQIHEPDTLERVEDRVRDVLFCRTVQEGLEIHDRYPVRVPKENRSHGSGSYSRQAGYWLSVHWSSVLADDERWIRTRSVRQLVLISNGRAFRRVPSSPEKRAPKIGLKRGDKANLSSHVRALRQVVR